MRLLTDKLVQEIAIAIDNIHQNYQEQIEKIIHSATKKLQEVKQDVNINREKIDELNKSHQKIQKILNYKSHNYLSVIYFFDCLLL